MATYATVEAVLARMHDADETIQRKAFRGRIKHLQRLGLPTGAKPGRGRRIEYGIEEVFQFALALELSEFGLDPTVIVEIIKRYWEILFRGKVLEQFSSQRDLGLVLVIFISFMSSSWKAEGDVVPALSSMIWHKRTDPISSIVNERRRRFMVIDVWEMLQEFERQEKIR